MLKDKVALVTGAARGLGLNIAETLGRNGAKVVIADLDADGLREAEAQLRAAGIDARTATGNVASVPDVQGMVGATMSAFGRLDVLVNNAGGSAHTPLKIEDVEEEHFDRVMGWNVRGTFFCIKVALPHLKVRGGSIVNMASIAGRAGTELVSPQYSASKGAIIAMTRNLARHLGPHGIRVNAIAPGFIKSGPRAEAIWQKRDESQVLNQVPLRRRGEMDEIGQAALFLASDQSSYTTGAVIDVNGGFMTA
jgi:NAD(P)-dependent dehydrogenase (short-subunit alcohol dehydrogenase family)